MIKILNTLLCLSLVVFSTKSFSVQDVLHKTNHLFVVDQYINLLGMKLQEFPDAHASRAKKVKYAGHEPEVYIDAIKYIVSKDVFFFFFLGEDEKILSAEFYGNKFKTNNGIEIGDALCKVSNIHDDFNISAKFDDRGFYIYLESTNNSLIFQFESNYLEDKILEKYLQGVIPKQEEVCKTKLLRIYIKEINGGSQLD